MSRRFKPRRRLRSEVFSIAVAVAVPAVLFVVFPLAALRPLPLPPQMPAQASCAFVTLTPEQKLKALAAARTAWQLDRGTARRTRIDLLSESLPVLPPRPVLDISLRSTTRRAENEPYDPDPLPPTLAAPPPAQIMPQPDADAVEPTFSREELLKLN